MFQLHNSTTLSCSHLKLKGDRSSEFKTIASSMLVRICRYPPVSCKRFVQCIASIVDVVVVNNYVALKRASDSL